MDMANTSVRATAVSIIACCLGVILVAHAMWYGEDLSLEAELKWIGAAVVGGVVGFAMLMWAEHRDGQPWLGERTRRGFDVLMGRKDDDE